MSSASYAVEQFSLADADPAQLSALISETFEHHGLEEGGSIAFDEVTFRLIFGSPHSDAELFVRAVHRPSGKLVGFLGGIPRKLSVSGQVRRFTVPAWASVHWEHQRQGLALRMGRELLRVAREGGYDGGIAMFEPEAHGIDTARAVMREASLELSELCLVKRFLIRVLDVREACRAAHLSRVEQLALRALQHAPSPRSRNVRRARPADHERLLELTRDHESRNDIAVVRERDDFLWYLSQPEVVTVVHEDSSGVIDGFLLAWPMLLAGFGQRVPLGWLDLVHTHRLKGRAARDLCRALCIAARDHGWAGLQMPHIPYFDPFPFWRARFVPYPKRLIVAGVSFGAPLPSRPRRIHLDWR